MAQKDSLSISEKEGRFYEIYTYNNKIDIPLTATAIAVTAFNFSQIFNKNGLSEAEVLALDPYSVSRFDGEAVDNFEKGVAVTSDVTFGLVSALPLLYTAMDKKMKEDYGKLALLYLEAMSLTGLVYSSSQQFSNRLRPYTYNPDAPMALRISGGSKNSFFSGHTATVATASFFLARTYADYHPESNDKWIYYGGALLATSLTGYLRVEAGKHFPSDVIVGGIIGALSGYLVPTLHRNKFVERKRLSILPVSGEFHGLQLAIRF